MASSPTKSVSGTARGPVTPRLIGNIVTNVNRDNNDRKITISA